MLPCRTGQLDAAACAGTEPCYLHWRMFCKASMPHAVACSEDEPLLSSLQGDPKQMLQLAHELSHLCFRGGLHQGQRYRHMGPAANLAGVQLWPTGFATASGLACMGWLF